RPARPIFERDAEEPLGAIEVAARPFGPAERKRRLGGGGVDLMGPVKGRVSRRQFALTQERDTPLELWTPLGAPRPAGLLTTLPPAAGARRHATKRITHRKRAGQRARFCRTPLPERIEIR